jgi:hypothetical protein
VRYEWMERIMPRNLMVDRPDRVLVIGTIEDNMTVGHKVWENQLSAWGYDPTSRLVYDKDCGFPTRGARVATLCIRRGSSASRTPLPFSLVAAERLPPRSFSFALMDYKVPPPRISRRASRKGVILYCPTMWGTLGGNPCTRRTDLSSPWMLSSYERRDV